MAIPRGSCKSGAPITAATRRFERVVQIDHYQAAVAEHVGVRSGDDDPPSAVQNAVRIESERALQEIIAGIAVEQRADAGRFAFWIGIADDDEAFVFVRHVEIGVERMDGFALR